MSKEKQRKHDQAPKVWTYKFLNSATPVWENGEWRRWYKSTYIPGELDSFTAKHYWVKLQLDMASVASELTDETYVHQDAWRVIGLAELNKSLTFSDLHFLRYWTDVVVSDEANMVWCHVYSKERKVKRFETDKKGRVVDVTEPTAERMAFEAKSKFEEFFK